MQTHSVIRSRSVYSSRRIFCVWSLPTLIRISIQRIALRTEIETKTINKSSNSDSDDDGSKSHWKFANIDKTCSSFWINAHRNELCIALQWTAPVRLLQPMAVISFRMICIQVEGRSERANYFRMHRAYCTLQLNLIRCRSKITVRSINDFRNLIWFHHSLVQRT